MWRAPWSQGGFGARKPVSLEQCALACQAAQGCDSFTFNPTQRGCFLKNRQCPLRNDCQVSAMGGLDGGLAVPARLPDT